MYFFLKLDHLLTHFENLDISLTERPIFQKKTTIFFADNSTFPDRYTNSAPLSRGKCTTVLVLEIVLMRVVYLTNKGANKYHVNLIKKQWKDLSWLPL